MGRSDEISLHVCIGCQAGTQLAEGEATPGRRLHDALAALPTALPLRVRPTTCMANCERGCSAAISAPGKWSYLLGRLSPELASDLLIYAAAYAASASGTVMPSRRPASLRDIVMGRLPAPEQFGEQAA
jgi:predicted metal-binding protein